MSIMSVDVDVEALLVERRLTAAQSFAKSWIVVVVVGGRV